MKLRIAFGSLVMVLSAAVTSSAGVKSLSPSKDNAIFESTGVQNSNGLGDFFAGRTNQGANSIRRGLIHFDIATTIPSGVTITSATLTLREMQGNNGDRLTSLHRMLQDRGQGTSLATGMSAGNGAPAQDGDATWLHTFHDFGTPAASQDWTAAGGDFVGAASASRIVSDDLGPGQFFDWSSDTMATDVQDWLDNPGSNFGWIIRGVESVQQTAKRFNSVEATNPGFRPVLLVTYVPEPGTIGLALISAAGVGVFVRMRRRLN